MTPELLSPAGSFDAALAAFQYGADAVYLGLPQFSARADADNVTPERLRALLAYARTFEPAKKVYVTFNTTVQDAELPQALETLDALDDLAPDGVIVQDLGIVRLIRDHFPHLALHASTQLAVHNLEGVQALKALGFTRVVLARELTLEEIRRIVRESGVEIEIFIHGALCYSYSGLCLFSSHTAARSGNRGRCAYCCREPFSPLPELCPATSAPRLRFPFSMRDLALAPLLDEAVAAGVHSLKIEGRMKSPLYVACVTDYYRQKLSHALTPDAERAFVEDLQTIFSRPWTSLYAHGADRPTIDVIDPLAIGHRGAQIGQAEAVFRDRDGRRWLRFPSGRALEKHDGLQLDLPNGGKPFGFAVNELRAAGTTRPVIGLPARSRVEVALPDEDVPTIPPGTPVFCSASQAVRRRYTIHGLRESALDTGRPASVRVALTPSEIFAHAEAAFERAGDVSAEITLAGELAPSRQPEKTAEAVRKAFERLGDTPWRLGELALDDPAFRYAPASKLNEARRAVFAKLTDAWAARRAEKRAAIAEAWQLDSPPERHPAPARWSLKLRADSATLPATLLADFDALVLSIGHASAATCEQRLTDWGTAIARDRIRLALPAITRATEMACVKDALGRLANAGWSAWECADLAGYRLLDDAGLTPVSADWSLYAFNRMAIAELVRLGIKTFVTSPENSLENLLAMPADKAELLVFQHTPLFLSATAPCLPEAITDTPLCLTDRRGRRFMTRRLDDVWATVWEKAFCIADRCPDTGLSRFRIDLSWSPDESRFPDIIRDVRAGRCPADTHDANFSRGLA